MGHCRSLLCAALFMAVVGSSKNGFSQVVPTVTLATQLSESTVHLGDTITATVTASVSGGSASDGIVAYDLDIFPLVKSGIDIVGLPVLPPDNIISEGSADPITGGVLGIIGIYDAPGIGIDAPVTLFTFEVHADEPGVNSISAGLSVEPDGTGVPFILNVSGDYVDPSAGTPAFSVDSSKAVAPLTVLPVPEPGSGLLAGALLAGGVMWKFGRSRRSRAA